jgi:hypothetical protein
LQSVASYIRVDNRTLTAYHGNHYVYERGGHQPGEYGKTSNTSRCDHHLVDVYLTFKPVHRILCAISLVLLTACSAASPRQTYEYELAQRPYPATGQALEQECRWLVIEARRVSDLSENMKNSRYAMQYQAIARKKTDALKQRQRQLGCGVTLTFN